MITGLLVVDVSWSFDSIESLVGKLGHTVHIVPHMAAYLRSLIPNPEPLEVDWVGDASSSYG